MSEWEFKHGGAIATHFNISSQPNGHLVGVFLVLVKQTSTLGIDNLHQTAESISDHKIGFCEYSKTICAALAATVSRLPIHPSIHPSRRILDRATGSVRLPLGLVHRWTVLQSNIESRSINLLSITVVTAWPVGSSTWIIYFIGHTNDIMTSRPWIHYSNHGIYI